MNYINYDAAGLLSDIIPSKLWHYCGWCSKPIVTPLDMEQYPYAQNVLATLCCSNVDHRNKPLPTTLYIETELASYVFPYSDEILHMCIFKYPPTYKDIISAPIYTWESGRDLIQSNAHIVIWTNKVVGYYHSGSIDIIPKHPQLAMSFID